MTLIWQIASVWILCNELAIKAVVNIYCPQALCKLTICLESSSDAYACAAAKHLKLNTLFVTIKSKGTGFAPVMSRAIDEVLRDFKRLECLNMTETMDIWNYSRNLADNRQRLASGMAPLRVEISSRSPVMPLERSSLRDERTSDDEFKIIKLRRYF
jgi:hypothetical protein